MENKNTSAIPKLIENLYAPRRETVLAALADTAGAGDERLVIPLLKVYADWQDEAVRTKIREVLYQLKTEKALPELVKALNMPELYGQHELILASMWNSGFFPQEDLKDIVRAAIQGDYMVTLEALTVVENMVGPFEADELADVIADVQEYLDDAAPSGKTELLQNLQMILTDFQNYA